MQVELLSLHRLCASLGRYRRGRGPAPSVQVQVKMVEAGEDDRGDSDRYADEYNPIFIFRFYQLAECKEEASPVPGVPGLKDQLEQRLAMKKNSQWFIQ